MSWNRLNEIPVNTHIFVTISSFWNFYLILSVPRFDTVGRDYLVGKIVLVPLFTYIQLYMS